MTRTFERMMAFDHALHERCADQIRSFRWGTAFFNTKIPHKFGLNFLRVESSAGEITAEGLIEEADALMAHLDHRKIHVLDEQLAARLVPGFASLGWKIDRLLWMAHEEDTGRIPASGVARELTLEEHRAAKDAYNRREPYVTDEEIARQMLASDDVVTAATNKRAFGAVVGDRVVSMCELYSDGVIAQIEDVATVAEHRRKGLSTTVVLEALGVALREEHEIVFLIADEDDWPRTFYEKLGFRTVGRTFEFVKLPPGHPGY